MGLKIGDWVKVERGGDVIPKVAEVVEDAEHPRGNKDVRLPDAVPGVRKRRGARGGRGGLSLRECRLPCTAAWHCRALGQPRGDEYRGAGRSVSVRTDYAARLVKSVADLYSLNEEDLASLKQDVERNGIKKQQRAFGPVEIKKLLKEIENSKHAGLARVLMGLSIRFVGERTAELLAQEFGSMDAIMDAERRRTGTRGRNRAADFTGDYGLFRAAGQSGADRAPEGCRRKDDRGEEAADQHN